MENQTSKKQASGKKRLLWIIPLFALLSISVIVLSADLWYIATFGRTRFDSIIFTLRSGMKGTSGTLVWGYLLKSLLPALLVSAALLVPLGFALHKKKLHSAIAIVLLIAVSLGSLSYAAIDSQMVEWLIYSNRETGFYAEEYIDPNDRVIFPKEKRNLVCIVLESMETTYLSEELGGGVKNNLIPELYELARDNVNFSQNDGVGGFLETTGATWSIGALVSQTSGIPIVPLVDANEKSTDGRFLPGVTTLMDLLHEQGYYQGFMLGSNAGFADTGLYFSTHGVDEIYDYSTAQADGIVSVGYDDGWWGIEDYRLYDYAKQVLGEYAEQDQPFALTLMTIDTHTPGGHFVKECCEKQYSENYDNVIACASRQAAAFVAWLQEQPYYEDTTVVILGDHRSMDNLYVGRNVAAGYERHVYNCYINVADGLSTENCKNRKFTTQDMFPTTLAALGCKIQGDRLGLGTNLFSDETTLCERIGYDELCANLYGDKAYYNEHFRVANNEGFIGRFIVPIAVGAVAVALIVTLSVIRMRRKKLRKQADE